ncbi:hypothetical protein OIDMADRAFT_125871 [Oidiodendron maius Zn]|uniref:Major facilitator superfamily (MFS) profile domain-containing protein n=1 Tax=Oidiodendron maius (strain Zn) TaxID=913774 RepID=A0A0C3CLN3_OIDMZ|nr:hypothetical protein OIDMADRAFT_125871 [Oidiodendron maius Zn]
MDSVRLDFKSDDTISSIPYINPLVEKRLKMKLDLIIIPILALGYVFNSLDRSNLGNAKTAGLSKDIQLTGNQYNLVLTWYYIPFIIFGPIMTLVTKHFSGKYNLPFMLFGFGIASACTSVVRNYGQLVACRILVGLFEAGYLASNVFYLSTFYTRNEIAARIGIFYAGSVLASAFGGLLAFGIFHVASTAFLFTWSYLFIIEGVATVVIAVVLFFVLPKGIRTTCFLNEEEKGVAEARMLSDSVDTLNVEFVWSEAVREFKTWHVYYRACISITFGVLLASNANFLAIITQRLGYSVVKTNLYTVAPALSASIVLVMVCFASDYFKTRGIIMAGVLCLSVIGYIILMTVDVAKQRGVAYFAIFLCTIGAYPMSVIFSAWVMDNITNLNARALTTGCLISIGNAAGLISSNIFFQNEAPRYISALIGNAVCAGVCMIFCIGYVVWMRLENKRRDRLYGTRDDITAGIGDCRDPNFRFRT